MLESMKTAHTRAIDVETSGLNVLEDYITGISLSWQEGTGYYIPINHEIGTNLDQTTTIEKLRPSLEDPNIINVAHGKKFDGMMLAALDFDKEWAKNNSNYATDLWLTAYANELGILNAQFEKFGLSVTFQYDTMIMAYLTGKYARIGTGRSTASLKKIVQEELGIQMVFIEELMQKNAKGTTTKKRTVRIQFEKLDPDEDIPVTGGKIVKPYEYACADSDMTLRLFNRLLPKVKDLFLLRVDTGVIPLTKLMELNGVYANVEKMDSTYKMLTAEAAKVKQLVFRDATEAIGYQVDFELSSPSQVGKILFDELKYPVIERSEKTGKALTNAKVLDVIGKDFPLVANILTWRSLRKNAEDFFKGMKDYISPVDKRIHCSYATAHVSSGRFASENPNMQNQPRLTEWKVFDKELPDGAEVSEEGHKFYTIKSNLRRCYEAVDDFYILEGDYSQIEYRVFAGRSQARALLNSYRDGADLHTRNAAMIFGIPEAEVTTAIRTEAKTYSFGIMYGMGAGGIALRTGRSKTECQRLYDRYFEAIPEGKQHIRDITDAALQNGYVTTHFRRQIWIPELKSSNRSLRFRGEREAFNMTIQGCMHGDEVILTLEDGLISLQDIVGKVTDAEWNNVRVGTGVHRMIWNGVGYVPCEVVYSGQKQLTEVTFTDGTQVRCSPEHKFLREDTARNQHWREAKDLIACPSNNPDRVCLSPAVVKTSEHYPNTQEPFPEICEGSAHNCNNYDANVLFDELTPFELGCLLGRLASDGCVQVRETGGSYVQWLVAEHEEVVLSYLESLLLRIGWKYSKTTATSNRVQKLHSLSVYSKSLAEQLSIVRVKTSIPRQVSCCVETLRGYLRGFIDGDGGVSGTNLSIAFGKYQHDAEHARELQKALKFFGVRTSFGVYSTSIRLRVSGYYDEVFLGQIGFINPVKTEKLQAVPRGAKRGRHVQTVQSVVVTDAYVPMFDVVNVPGESYVASGFIVHNTAADILRIGMNRLTKQLIAQYGPRFNDKLKPMLTTHDSLAFMVHKSIHPDALVELLKTACEVEIKNFPVISMDFSVGPNYGEMLAWEKLRSTFNPNEERLGIGSDVQTMDEDIEYLSEHSESVSEPSVIGHKHVTDVLPVSTSPEAFAESAIASVEPSVASPYPASIEDPVDALSYSLVIKDDLTQIKAVQLKELLVHNPGKNMFTLLLPDGEIPMTGYPTSLGKSDEALFKLLFDCQLVLRTVDPKVLSMGIKL
jgi:DNA polymerase I-like protein with 3'-5' exonuclease and polymerase domains